MKKSLIVFLIVLLFSCSSEDMAGGGTGMPNGVVEIVCVDSLSNIVVGADVQLLGIIITESGDSSFFKSNLITDPSGKCCFKNVPNGKFVISINDSISNKGALITRVEVNGNLWKNDNPIVLYKITTLKGRVVNWKDNSDFSVIIPGIEKSFAVNDSGFFTIPGFLNGNIDICLVSESIVNYLSLKSSGSNDNDTTYIRDVNFVSSDLSDSYFNNYYEQKAKRAFQIRPEYYEPHNKPAWYNEHDFSKVDYLIEDHLGEYKTDWHFPVIVGISDSILKHYGNDSVALHKLIENQFDQINISFNEAYIGGIIKFSLDSIYLITGSVDAENILPPKGYALRLIYDGFSEGTFGNWYASNRVASYSYSPLSEGGMFGDKGCIFLMWMLGLSRGCYYICESEVYAANNNVTGIDFKLNDYVMNSRSIDNWSSINSMLINYNNNSFNCDNEVLIRRFPDSISLKIENSNSLSLSNVKIDIYTVANHNHSVKDSVVYTGTTDNNGEFFFQNNPFIEIDKKSIKHHNLLIRTIYSGDTTYNWLPLFEVSDSCFIDSVMSFQKVIKM